MKKVVFLLFCVFIAALTSVSAATPSEYRSRIDHARLLVDELRDYSGSNDRTNEQRTIVAILKFVPDTEKIEWAGSSVETGNQWLKNNLDLFAAETKQEKREAILDAIGERLLAISQSVGELDLPGKTESSKDADKQKLAEILGRPEYQKPEVNEESLFQKWWRRFLEWIESLFPRAPLAPTPAQGPDLTPFKLILQVVVFAAVIGLVGFLLWKFAPYFSRLVGSATNKETGDRVILGERIGENESAADLFREAERLARQGDLRGAIRKGYIAALCELGDRKIVRLARHKTNRDYLSDVRKRERIHDGLRGLTTNFERNWYGLRNAEQADWDDFCLRYHATIDEVKLGG